MDAHRMPLQPPYKGPYKVLKRGPKSFLLDLESGPDSISVDRLKPAFLPASDPDAIEIASRPTTTRFGRESRPRRDLPTNPLSENLGGRCGDPVSYRTLSYLSISSTGAILLLSPSVGAIQLDLTDLT
ncbi:hypothetical protein M513_12237 [Trichuris suis]|uniref:Uncharacterized protein n=1 Tax=Trichuris suis TaxID=68888 RepID=A0A085LPI3_9BILA|nr:hypothetical protein M513_12237 [Trichuris suis]